MTGPGPYSLYSFCKYSRQLVAVSFAVALLIPTSITAASLGMVSDNHSDSISFFNADLDVVTSKLAAQPGKLLGDCALASDETQAYTTSSSSEVTMISLAHGTEPSQISSNRIAISNLGVDMALSPNDRFLVMAGGGALAQPLSVIDTRLEKEIATADPFIDHTSVEFCDNGTMLVTTNHGAYYDSVLDNALYDASIDQQGEIELKGNRLASGSQPNNAVCAPGSLAGVLIDRQGGLTSFTLPGLEPAENINLESNAAVAAVFSRDGKRLFVRTRDTVEAFEFNPVSGDMRREWKQALMETSNFYGMDQIAIHPDSSKLYVDGGNSMLILDPESGQQAGLIELGDATGICFANVQGPPTGQALASVSDPAP